MKPRPEGRQRLSKKEEAELAKQKKKWCVFHLEYILAGKSENYQQGNMIPIETMLDNWPNCSIDYFS